MRLGFLFIVVHGMELIKELGSRKMHNGTYRVALFLCPHCYAKKELPYRDGLRNKSCGCSINKKHGDTGTALHKIWLGMNGRCYVKNASPYKYYGGRGIIVCEEWRDSYELFKEWALANGWEKGLHVDRRNGDKNYCPGNCRIVTLKENNRNKRGVKLTKEKALKLRLMNDTGNYTQRRLAALFSISEGHVSEIVNGKYWN